jgi:hypothetical protein
MSWPAERLSGTYRDLIIVRIASVVPSPEPDDRVGPVLIPQQQLVVLARVHLGLGPLPGVPILQPDTTSHLSYVTPRTLGRAVEREYNLNGG